MSKISMFTDKVYDDMDDISKLVEPIESAVNNSLSEFPDEIEITSEYLAQLYDDRYGWGELRADNILEKKSKELGLIEFRKLNLGEVAIKFFKFEVRDLGEDETVMINYETGVMSHQIFLVKHTIGYDEKELEKMAKSALTKHIQSRLWSNKVCNKPRLNELADLFGAKEVMSDRSFKGKVRKFCKHINELVDDRKLDIRDLALCDKFAQWVVLYVSEGNLAALNNITRIKIMMHENRPIYSIEERGVI
jgi:hypothetical protein